MMSTSIPVGPVKNSCVNATMSCMPGKSGGIATLMVVPANSDLGNVVVVLVVVVVVLVGATTSSAT